MENESKKSTSGKGTTRRKDKEGLVLLGKRLQEVRKNKEMSQEELAYSTGISLSMIGRIERASGNPTVTTIFTLCRKLDIEVSELFTFKLSDNIII